MPEAVCQHYLFRGRRVDLVPDPLELILDSNRAAPLMDHRELQRLRLDARRLHHESGAILIDRTELCNQVRRALDNAGALFPVLRHGRPNPFAITRDVHVSSAETPLAEIEAAAHGLLELTVQRNATSLVLTPRSAHWLEAIELARRLSEQFEGIDALPELMLLSSLHPLEYLARRRPASA